MTNKQALEAIREILWPATEPDPDHLWDVEAIEDVARILLKAGYGPKPPPMPEPFGPSPVYHAESRQNRFKGLLNNVATLRRPKR